MPNLIEVTNTQMVSELGSQAKIGKLFAFFDDSLFQGDGALAWVDTFVGQRRGPRLISLLDVEGTRLPGVRHDALELKLELGVLLSDKELYREGHDTVHLSVLDPLRPSMDCEVVLELQGSEFRSLPVRLNCHGMATVPLSHLPVGQYSARFKGQEQAHPLQFTVAEYRLVPLVATMLNKSFQSQELSFTLKLESFGHPVNGEVLVELMSQGQRSQNATLMCAEGELQGAFPLRGEGPFSLNLQMMSELSRTATVPLSGTRASEREATIFSRLGKVIQGSLLPTPGSVEVRGLHLEEGGVSNSPFVLERVNDSRALLIARSSAESLTVVVADPTVQQATETAPSAEHPERVCKLYREGKQLFAEGHYAAARQKLEEGRRHQKTPHCYYSYFIACCYARLERGHEAMAWLRQSVLEGWKDWQHMSSDPDLESLQNDSGFQLLCQGGRRLEVFEKVEAGQAFDLEIPAPLAFLAIGAYVKGKPFEAWSFLIPPSQLEAELTVDETVEPGQTLEVKVTCSEPSGVLLVVKDSRLQTGDTSTSKLASQLKDCVEKAKELFPPHEAPESFHSLATAPSYPQPSGGADFDSLFDVPAEPVLRRGLVPRGGSSRSRPMLGGGRVLGAAVGSSRPARPLLSSSSLLGRRPGAGTEMDLFCEPEAEGIFDGQDDLFGDEGFEHLLEASLSPSVSKPEVARPRPTTQEAPEVLYVGILETRDGEVSVKVDLPDNFGDYQVQATVMSGQDWRTFEASCQVKADPYVHLEMPPFVHTKDVVIGRVLTTPDAEVELYFNGELQTLMEDHSFRVKPGLYRVRVTSKAGLTRTLERRVNTPGKLIRLVHSVQLLQSGEILDRKVDPSIQSLKILPGLKQPFKLLVNTTANYGHLCCEQTAAKMMSATLMALSGDDKGEAIFISGTHRMESMLLRGGGFSMYPGRGGRDDYWGPKAVLYLLGLKGLVGRPEFSATMNQALQRCLEMAQECQAVYRISWPAPEIQNCQQAYWSLRESRDPKALSFVQDYVQRRMSPEREGRVQFRAQACYAAATLLLCKTRVDTALELANRVFAQLEGGRLYSTYDSVAAIVLMNELRRAGIGASDGEVEVDGQVMTVAQAMKLAEFEKLVCQEKMCLVQVSKVVEESWEEFDASVPMQVSLVKDGRPASSFRAGDALELKIELEEGYKVGDLVWVCLPDCLSRVMGGGQVKRFSVDFEGLDSLTLPLAATGVTGELKQHYAVCVRNMFEEERVGNPGLLTVRVGV